MKICLIGAGTMGSGIASVFAAAGDDVYLFDASAEIVSAAIEKLRARQNKLAASGKISVDAASTLLSRIFAGTGADYSYADLVIEAVGENMALKRKLFADADKLAGENTVFATNTSSLSITEMAIGLSHHLVGMHFFNPAPKMALVEVIAGLTTLPQTVEWTKALAVRIGKKPVEVREAPGFVVNRILIPMINEGVFVLSEGVASAADIDAAMKLGANHPMGPLELADLIGCDVVLSIMEVLHAETGDDKYRPCPLLRKMVRAGLLGRKSGEGFYKY